MAVFFVGHKEFQRSQNKRPEPALFRVSAIEISPFQHAHEELLREILRLIGRITAPAQIGIQRILVVFAERNQSGASLLPMWIAGSDYQGPPRRGKLGWSRQRVHCLAVRHGLILTGIPLNRIRNPEPQSYTPITTACRTLPWHFSGSGWRTRRPSTIGRSPGTPFWLSPCRPQAWSRAPTPDRRANRTVPNRGGPQVAPQLAPL